MSWKDEAEEASTAPTPDYEIPAGTSAIAPGSEDASAMSHKYTADDVNEELLRAKRRWKETPTLDQMAAAYGMGARRIVANTANMLGAKNAFGMDTTDEGIRKFQQSNAPDIEAMRSTPIGGIMSLLGEGVTSLPAVMAPEAAAGSKIPLVSAALRPLFSTPARTMITGGGIQGAAMAEPGERTKGALTGALVGGAFPVAGWAGKSALYGVKPTEEMQWLMDRGVRLTPGMMKPQGWLNQVEQSWAGSLPYFGAKITARRNAAYDDLLHAVTADTAPPNLAAFGKKDPLAAGVQPIPRGATLNDTYTSVDQAFGEAYDKVKGYKIPWPPEKMNLAGSNEPLFFEPPAKGPLAKRPEGLLQKATNDRRITATEADRKAVRDAIAAEWSAIKPDASGQLDSAQLLEFRSTLRRRAREAQADPNAQKEAALWRSAEDKVTDVLESQLKGSDLAWLRATDKQYAKNSIVTDALKRSSTGERFTPSQLSAAVKKSQLAHGTPRGWARGEGAMRDWSSAADEAFTKHYAPKTGAMVPAVAAPIAAMAAFPPSAVPITGLTGLLTTEAGRKLAGGMYPWQKGGQLMVEGALKRLKNAAANTTLGYAAKPLALNLARARMIPGAPSALTNAQYAAEDQLNLPELPRVVVAGGG